jgi:hypothetical protein
MRLGEKHGYPFDRRSFLPSSPRCISPDDHHPAGPSGIRGCDVRGSGPDLGGMLSHGSWRRGRIEGLLLEALRMVLQTGLARGSRSDQSLFLEA